MKTIRRFSLIVAALSWALAGSVRAELWAGAATADITPSLQGHKIPLNGYGARHKKPATGVHDPIMAKVLVLKSGDAFAAIAVVDLVLVSPELRQAVLQRLEGTGIGDQNLLLSATHTHSAPGAMQKNLIAHVAFGKYQKWLVEWTADQIAAANAKLAAAKVKEAAERQAIADRLTLAVQTVPHFHVFADIDMEEALAWRAQLNAAGYEHVTVTDIIVFAAARALRDNPRLCAHVERDAMILKGKINVGVAVAVWIANF